MVVDCACVLAAVRTKKQTIISREFRVRVRVVFIEMKAFMAAIISIERLAKNGRPIYLKPMANTMLTWSSRLRVAAPLPNNGMKPTCL
jgi:hypothetical protein